MLSQGKTTSAASQRKSSFPVWALLLYLLAIGMIAVGLYYGYVSWRLTTQGSRTAGTVVRLVSSEDDNGDYSYAPVVQYQANGGTYTFESHNYTNPPAYHEGQVVQLLYDGNHPDNARISNFFELWLLPFLLIPFGLLTAAVNLFVGPMLTPRRKA